MVLSSPEFAYTSFYYILPTLAWATVVYLCLLSPFRREIDYVVSNFRKKSVSLPFLVYLPIHLFIYGLAVEDLLVSIYGAPFRLSKGASFIGYSPFTPSIPGIVLDLLFNPSFNLLLPPYYSLALTPYAVALGFLISLAVSSNIGKIVEISRVSPRKRKLLVFIPSLGLVGGSSCCLSLPSIVALYTPLSQLTLLSVGPGLALVVIYVILPALVAYALKRQFDDLSLFVPRLLRLKGLDKERAS